MVHVLEVMSFTPIASGLLVVHFIFTTARAVPSKKMTFLSTGLKSLSHFAKCGGLKKFTQSPKRVSYRHMSSANLGTAVAVPGANPRDGEYVPHLGLSFRVMLCFESKRGGRFPCKKWSFAAHFGTATVLLIFFVFGPATVVEFRAECILEKRFNCETNTKIEGYTLQANQIPTKMKLCLGFVWSQLKGYATNLTANGGLEMDFFPKDVSSQGSSEDCWRISHHTYPTHISHHTYPTHIHHTTHIPHISIQNVSHQYVSHQCVSIQNVCISRFAIRIPAIRIRSTRIPPIRIHAMRIHSMRIHSKGVHQQES